MDYDAEWIEEFQETTDSQDTSDVSDIQSDRTFSAHVSVLPLPDTFDLEYALRSYNPFFLADMARERDLDTNSGTINSIIRDLIDGMDVEIPHLLDTMSDGERAATKYILEHGHVEVSEGRKMFDNVLTDPSAPYEFGMFDSYVHVYTLYGILVPGAKKIDHQYQSIVTIPSDVARIIATYTKWNSKIKKHTPVPRLTKRTRGRIQIYTESEPDLYYILAQYALDNYGKEFRAERAKCPYNTNLPPELALKQQMTWFTLDRINPATGMTIAKEFISMPGTPIDVVYYVEQTLQLFFDRFMVLGHSDDYILAYGINTNKKYRILSHNPDFYPVGCIFEGRIHPFEDKYKACGITTRAVR